MIPHLHLHLEPSIRKQMEVGRKHTSVNGDEFFAFRRVDRTDRPRTKLTDLRDYLLALHAEQRGQGVDYVEMRLSPERFIRDGASWERLLGELQAVLWPLSEPRIRVVLVIVRGCPDKFVREIHDTVLDTLPPVVVGLDLAGDERRPWDISSVRSLFFAARETLGLAVHAGEFGTATDVWRAVDELGAQRIGHAVAAGKSTALLRRLAGDGIMVEVSLTSNLALGAVKSPGEHPVTAYVEHGVPICFNTDIPVETGCTLDDELQLASRILGLGWDEILEIQRNAMRFHFGRDQDFWRTTRT